MDRRDFIKQSALATAGFTILPSGSLFADTTKARLGYIGVGLRGRNHIGEGLLRDDV
jgi:anaerobic selenocysteine-containing dehydrogenase